MPFDSATEPKLRGTPVRRYRGEQAKARRAADVLDFVIRKYETGEWPWVRGECNIREPEKGICAGYALSLATQLFRQKGSPAHDYAVMIITEQRYWAARRARLIALAGLPNPPTNERIVIWYNDAPGRTYPQVLSVLRTARDLALKEAGDAF
jgi:hypothetical protein